MRIELRRVSIWLDHEGVERRYLAPVMWVTLDRDIGATAGFLETSRVGISLVDRFGIGEIVDESWGETVSAHVRYLGQLANLAADYVARLASWAGIECDYGLNMVGLRVEPDSVVVTKEMAVTVRHDLIRNLHSLCNVDKVSGENALYCEVAVSEFTDMATFWSAPDIIRQSIARFATQGV